MPLLPSFVVPAWMGRWTKKRPAEPAGPEPAACAERAGPEPMEHEPGSDTMIVLGAHALTAAPPDLVQNDPLFLMKCDGSLLGAVRVDASVPRVTIGLLTMLARSDRSSFLPAWVADQAPPFSQVWRDIAACLRNETDDLPSCDLDGLTLSRAWAFRVVREGTLSVDDPEQPGRTLVRAVLDRLVEWTARDAAAVLATTQDANDWHERSGRARAARHEGNTLLTALGLAVAEGGTLTEEDAALLHRTRCNAGVAAAGAAGLESHILMGARTGQFAANGCRMLADFLIQIDTGGAWPRNVMALYERAELQRLAPKTTGAGSDSDRRRM